MFAGLQQAEAMNETPNSVSPSSLTVIWLDGGGGRAVNSSELFRVGCKVTFRSPSFPGAMPLWNASGMATAAPRGSRAGWGEVEWGRMLALLGMHRMGEGE